MPNSPKLDLRLPPELLAKIRADAEKSGKSIGDIVRAVLAKHYRVRKHKLPMGTPVRKVAND